MIAHTFDWVDREAAWRVEMSGWNDINLPKQLSSAWNSKADTTA